MTPRRPYVMHGAFSVIHVELLTRTASIWPILSYRCWSKRDLASRHAGKYLVSLHGFLKTTASILLLTLNQEDEVDAERATIQELCCSASDGEDRALVVGDPASVQVTVPGTKCERIRLPFLGWSRDDIVVPTSK
jgi:hypothetical protein